MTAATQFLDPRGRPTVPAEPYELRWDSPGAPPVVGILINNYPDSPLFGELLREAISARLPDTEIRLWNKMDATSAAPSELVEEIAGAASVSISLIGTCGSCTGGTIRDAVNLARCDRPAVALVTEMFREHGSFIASAAGMPDVPIVVLPHPVAGTGAENMKAIAEHAVDEIGDALGVPLAVRA